MAGATREFDFNTTVESSTVPDPGTPTNPKDTISKGFSDGEYTPRSSWEQTVANIAALRALPESSQARTNNQSSLVSDIDTFYKWDGSSSGVDDGDTIITPDDTSGNGRWLKRSIGGGGAAGAGSQIATLTMGETATTSDTMYPHEKSFIEITNSNNKINFNEGGGELTSTLTNQVFLWDTDENIAQFTTMVKTQLEAIGALTFTVSFSQSTRKITIAASGSFTLLWKTGTNGSDNTDTHAGTIMGYDDSSDTGSAASHLADNLINDTLDTKDFFMRTDGDFFNKSAAYFGFLDAGLAKYATATVKANTIDDGFSNSDLGEMFILGAHITIDATNNKLDFTRGGAFVATISSNNYFAPYQDLADEIALQMNAADSNSYNAVWNRDDDKWVISGTAAFSMEFSSNPSGSNIALTLSYTETDKGAATSHEAENVIGKLGKLGFADDVNITSQSVSAGFAFSTTERYFSQSTSDTYIRQNNNAKDWKADPSGDGIDLATDLHFHFVHINQNGIGVKVFSENKASANYKIYYTNNGGISWPLSPSVIPFNSNGTTDGFSGKRLNSYGLGVNRSIGKMDNNDLDGAIALSRYHTANTEFELWGLFTVDGGVNWALSNGGSAILTSASDSFESFAIDVRDTKATILSSRNDGTITTISIADDSGSGYASFSNTTTSNDYNPAYPAHCFIQFFSEQSGIEKHRLVIIGPDISTAMARIYYYKGDGTSEVTFTDAQTLGSAGTTTTCLGAARDETGLQNRIHYFGADAFATGATYTRAVTNETHNGGVLTVNNFSLGDINSGSAPPENFNGAATGSSNHFFWNKEVRAAVFGAKSYWILGEKTTFDLRLYFSTDTGASYSSILLKGDGAADFAQEYCLKYLSSINKLIVLFKRSDATANNQTKGQIYAGFINLALDGTPTLEDDFEQIDGGEVLADFQGQLSIAGSTNVMSANWLHDNTVNDEIWFNRLT